MREQQTPMEAIRKLYRNIGIPTRRIGLFIQFKLINIIIKFEKRRQPLGSCVGIGKPTKAFLIVRAIQTDKVCHIVREQNTYASHKEAV